MLYAFKFLFSLHAAQILNGAKLIFYLDACVREKQK